MACNDDFVFAIPHKTDKGKKPGGDIQHCTRRLVWCARIDNCDTAVMRSEGQGIPTRRECATVNPACGGIQKLATHGVERETLAPRCWLRAGVYTLDIRGEDTAVGVRGAGGQQDVIRVPSDRRDCAANGLFEMFGDPPVILFLKIADSDDTSTRADSELLFRRRPANERRRAVDAKKNKSWLPTRRCLLPNIGVAI